MTFAGLNYLAILVAAALGFGLGGIWYRLLGQPWMAAHGFTTETMRGHHGKGASPLPFIIAIAGNLIMAWVLAGLMGHIGAVSLRGGIISGAFVWLGFVLPTLAVNNTFGMRSPKLIAIDGGHWLAVLALMGAVIGAFGP
jgi:hypothetical protein